uniref:NADPH-flavin oxidoreductase n=1 Tax=Helicobacter pylori TaxID=210 RepID=Q8VLM6_HELPX|nr:NADPH-flavin oxidoreductase [Helicobacter pylori]AAL37260.1 NADPH-flavin oxidoreductase [Helicobacter pylori]
MDREQVIALQHQRFAAKKYDPNRRISQKDWEALVEVGRLAPSSIGLEPWKMLLLKNERMKKDLKPMAWGALFGLEGASHFVIYLARKGVTYDSDYVKKVMHEVKKRDYDTNSRFAQIIKNFQENDMKLNSERSLFDWASKQTYIQMANMMMAAAMLGIDSCPIEGLKGMIKKKWRLIRGKRLSEHGGIWRVGNGLFWLSQPRNHPKTRWKTEVIYEVIE